ncbi:MAG: TMEM175 family protein, partial [Candidatus Saccharibacteria bacterium]
KSPHRIEAFSDGVIAIIITIMVLDIKAPEGASIEAWRSNVPLLFAYTLSFMTLAIFWNNHHHLLKATKYVTSAVMWANMYLLFWLSLIPIVTAWFGQNINQKWPVILYSFVALMSGTAYFILTKVIVKANPDNDLQNVILSSKKEIMSFALYVLAFIFAFVNVYITYFIFTLNVVIWIVPDKRLEKIDS